jgi:hypothetical protein
MGGRLPCHKRGDTLVDLRMCQDKNIGFTGFYRHKWRHKDISPLKQLGDLPSNIGI